MLPAIGQAAGGFCLEQNKDLMKFILEIWPKTNKLTIAKLKTSRSNLFGLNYELVRRVGSIVPSQPYNIQIPTNSIATLHL